MPMTAMRVVEEAETLPVVNPFFDRGMTAKELSVLELPEPKWVVPGIIPEGLTLMVSKPKFGKSWLCLGLGNAVACDGTGKAFGKLDVEPGEALYLALEDSTRRLQSRQAIVLAGAPHPERLHFFTEWPRLDDDGALLIEEWIRLHPATRLVMIDTLAKIRPTKRKGGNGSAYTDDYSDIGELQQIATRHGVAVIVVHHRRKAGTNDVFDSVSGTLGLTGAADTTLVLSRDVKLSASNAEAVMHVTGRDVEEQELALRFDTERCHWILVGDAEECRRSKQRQNILDALKCEPTGMPPKELAEILGVNGGNVRRLLSKMVVGGEVVKRDDGKYTIPR
jgi:hypothetical protein